MVEEPKKKGIQMLRQNRKALSPVIASIILIAVTVAVAVVVASWMGSTTIELTEKVETATMTNAQFNNNTVVMVTILNNGPSKVTITSATIDEHTVTMSPVSLSVEKGSTATLFLKDTNFANNAKYTIKLITDKGNTLLYTTEANLPPPNLNPVVTDCGTVFPSFSSGGFAKYRVLQTQNVWAGTVQSINQTGATRTWTNPGNNTAVFTYNSVDDTLKNTFNGYQVNYTNISQKTSVKPAEWNTLVITLRNSSPNTTLRLNNVSLGSFSLGSFTVTPLSTNYWTITNYNFNNSFSLTGNIYLNGTFTGGSESNKILIEVGKQ
jgi:flagellin-like protein